jgi:serine/threonine protein kinase/tetratricopeptide (TPR) repeat protein
MAIQKLDEEAIFNLARKIESPDGRRNYLEQVCGADAALHQRVQALLRVHDEDRSFLQAPASSPLVTTAKEPIREGPGTLIGPYKLLQQIGEGGMGTVFMAEQSQPIQRKVALKLIKPGMDSRQVLARFEAERQALAMMDHVNIARVLDAGATESGRPYFVMELVHGVPITQYCDDNRLTPRERLELFVPVCQAIQHAHQKGIIHRDVKPSNVMVTLYDGKPVAKVIDFGVAKATEQKLTERTLFTQHGTMVGTLEYMSPEQAEMSAVGGDTRSDIYSLGVLLYELLTGSTPLSHKRVKEAAYAEILRRIKEEEPPRPSMRLSDSGEALASISAQRHMEPAKLTKLVRGELDWIVMKTLEKDRNRRYETANAFAADVQRYLCDETVEACRPSAGYKLRKFLRRNKRPVAAGLALIALLVLGTVGTSIGLVWALRAERAATLAGEAETQQRQDAETLRDRAQAAEKQAKEEAAIAKAVNDFLQNDLLAEAAPEKNPRTKKVTVEEVLGRAGARITGKFENQPRIEAAIRQTIGDTYYKLGDYPAAQPHLERSLEIRRRVLGEEHPDTLFSVTNLAALYMARGQYAKAEPLYVQTLDIRRRALGEEHPFTLLSMNNLATLYADQSQYAKAEPLYVKTLEARRRVLGEEHTDTLFSMNSLALLYLYQGQYTKAEPLLVKTLEVQRHVLGEEHPYTLLSMNALAGLYLRQGQYAQAEPLFVKTLDVRRRVLGEEHLNTLVSMSNLASLYLEQGQLAKAEPLRVKTLEVSRRVLGEEHPVTLSSMNNLAFLYQAQGKLPMAEPLFVKALEVRRRVRGEEHPDTLVSMSSLAMFYLAQGQFAKGELICREMLEKARKHHGETQTADALAALGENLLKQQKYADAEALLRQCLNVREQKRPDNWKTFHTKSMLGGSLLGQEKYRAAEPLLLAGYEGMKVEEQTIPAVAKERMREALERLVQLYDATEQKDKATVWRKKLEARAEADKKAEQPKEK